MSTPEQVARMREQLDRFVPLAEAWRNLEDSGEYRPANIPRPTVEQIIDYLWRHGLEPVATTRDELEAVRGRAERILAVGIITGTDDYNLLLEIEAEIGIDHGALMRRHLAKDQVPSTWGDDLQPGTNPEHRYMVRHRFKTYDDWVHYEYMSGNARPLVPGVDHAQMIEYLWENGIFEPATTQRDYDEVFTYADHVLVKGQFDVEPEREFLRDCEAKHGIFREDIPKRPSD